MFKRLLSLSDRVCSCSGKAVWESDWKIGLFLPLPTDKLWNKCILLLVVVTLTVPQPPSIFLDKIEGDFARRASASL